MPLLLAFATPLLTEFLITFVLESFILLIFSRELSVDALSTTYNKKFENFCLNKSLRNLSITSDEL